MIGSLIGGGLSILGSLFGGNSARRAARRNEGFANQFMTEGMGHINRGQNAAEGYLQQAGDLWKPFTQMGQQGAGLYADAMGLGGADGVQRAQDAFQTGPGYQFSMDQGLQALERRAAAQGRLQSGQTGIDTMNYATGLANQEWGNWMDRLGGYNNMWQTGITGQSGSLSDLASLNMQGAGMRTGVLGQGISALMGANNQRAEANQNMISGITSGLGTMAGGFGGHLSAGGGLGGYGAGFQPGGLY